MVTWRTPHSPSLLLFPCISICPQSQTCSIDGRLSAIGSSKAGGGQQWSSMNWGSAAVLLSVYKLPWSAADFFEKEEKKRFTSIKHQIKWDEAAGMLCIIISLKGMGNIKRLSALILRWVAVSNDGDSFNYWHNHRALFPALHLYPPIPTAFIVLHISFILYSINTKAYRALKGLFT